MIITNLDLKLVTTGINKKTPTFSLGAAGLDQRPTKHASRLSPQHYSKDSRNYRLLLWPVRGFVGWGSSFVKSPSCAGFRGESSLWVLRAEMMATSNPIPARNFIVSKTIYLFIIGYYFMFQL